MINPFPNIVCTEGVLSGSPRIDGRRLSVGDVVSFMKYYSSLQEVIDDYDPLSEEIRQALLYCSSLQCKQDNPSVFCHNCSLRRQQNGPLDTSDLEEMTFNDATFVTGDNSIFLGSIDELLEAWEGQDWLKIATDLLIDLRNDLFKD